MNHLEGDDPNLKSNNNDEYAILYPILLVQKTVIAAVLMNHLEKKDPNLKTNLKRDNNNSNDFTSLYPMSQRITVVEATVLMNLEDDDPNLKSNNNDEFASLKRNECRWKRARVVRFALAARVQCNDEPKIIVPSPSTTSAHTLRVRVHAKG
jgi:hypothetical protein